MRRGAAGRTYPWGDDWRRPPHFNTNQTAAVDAWAKGTTPEGVSGLGIVWEATRSWHGDYSAGVTRDPEGPENGEHIDVRGGSAWLGYLERFFGAYRSHLRPDFRSRSVGFRLGKDL